ncbi:hypothetical protein KY349_03985 [Candidatus Woesearchaeota archaeon]|jgi:hypothetical protein|nr:hypothetical protein [Candidatus Woesearchaeota archaeon]
MSSRYYTKRQYKKRPKRGEKAPARPKAFKSEASAKAWATKHGKKGAKIEAIAGGKKFKIRSKF